MALLDEMLEEAEQRRLDEEERRQQELLEKQEQERRRQQIENINRRNRQAEKAFKDRQLKEKPLERLKGGKGSGAGKAAGGAAKQGGSAAAKEAASAGATAAKTAVAEGLAAAGEAIAAFFAAAWPVILIILIIAAIILFVIVTVVVLCNQSGWAGQLTRLASSAGAAVGVLDQNYCKTFEGLTGVSQTLSNIQVPPPGGTVCAANIQPPAGAVMDCSQCVNLATYGIPLKPPPATNPFADPSMAQLLNRLYQINQNFQVTEAFCPVVNHSDAKHYNGKAVDIVAIPPTPAVVAKLYQDAFSVGFSEVLCEYPRGFLDAYRIDCKGYETTRGSNIHLDAP